MMTHSQKKPTYVFRGLASIALIFGLLTLISGGLVLFGADSYREMAGNYLSFVVIFNFLAGFAYLAAGIGIWLQRKWAIDLSFAIALLSSTVFVILGLLIFFGQAYEIRTVLAMAFRTGVWFSIFSLFKRKMQGS